MLEAADELCPEESKLFKKLTLVVNTVARRIGDMGENIMNEVCSE